MGRRTAAAVVIASTAVGAAGAWQRWSGRRRSATASAPLRSEGRGYPIVVHRLDGFLTLHTASFVAIGDLLPAGLLYPVRAPTGGALVAVSFMDKWAVTGGWGDDVSVLPPYAELIVSAVVSRRPRSPVASAAALLRVDPTLGAFPIQFPVTSGAWRDVARQEMGMPMFVADFALDVADPTKWRLVVSEEERRILEVAITPGGVPFKLRQTQTFFGSLEGGLVASQSEMRSVAGVRLGGGTLTLGTDHPVALGLHELAIAPRALATFTFPNGTVVLHRPRVIGPACVNPPYAGPDRALGSHTIRYPGTGPLPAGPSGASGDQEASPAFPAFD